MGEAEMKFRKNIERITPYIGGSERRDVVRLSNNENPLGTSRRAIEAAKGVGSLALYPDVECRKLRAALAKKLGIEEKRLIVGNGCDDILQILFQVFCGEGDGLVTQYPTFPIYRQLAEVRELKLAEVPLGKGFSFDAGRYLDAISDKTKLAVVCNPNNPTGTVVGMGDLRKIAEKANALIVDETYYLFAGCGASELVDEYDNVIIARSLGKDYGLAGARVGYAIASEKVVGQMYKVRLPYSVNEYAQRAAAGALEDDEFIQKTVRAVKGGRTYLERELKRLGLKAYPSGGNFVFVQVDDAKGISLRLMAKGISIRKYGKLRGFEKEYIRISVGTEEQNKRLVAALEEMK
ncbi:MAG: histidinol-phosphate transaminase [archaeon]